MRAECVPSCRDATGLWRAAAPHSGPAPDAGCVCGLYELFAPARSRGRERLAVVHGAVVLWGRIELHRLGMRAEYARIVALALPNSRRRDAAEGDRPAGRDGDAHPLGDPRRGGSRPSLDQAPADGLLVVEYRCRLCSLVLFVANGIGSRRSECHQGR